MSRASPGHGCCCRLNGGSGLRKSRRGRGCSSNAAADRAHHFAARHLVFILHWKSSCRARVLDVDALGLSAGGHILIRAAAKSSREELQALTSAAAYASIFCHCWRIPMRLFAARCFAFGAAVLFAALLLVAESSAASAQGGMICNYGSGAYKACCRASYAQFPRMGYRARAN